MATMNKIASSERQRVSKSDKTHGIDDGRKSNSKSESITSRFRWASVRYIYLVSLICTLPFQLASLLEIVMSSNTFTVS